MKKVTVTAKTVEACLEQALSQLQTSKERVRITVIQEPTKGFLGLGAKPAVVEVVLVEEKIVTPSIDTDLSLSKQQEEDQPIVQAKSFLSIVLEQMNVADVQINVQEKKDHVYFQLEGEKLGLIIGKRGQTLDALQYLTNVVANKQSTEYVRIVLDAENYREKRKKTLEQLADRLAKKVERTKQRVVLEPMNPAERRIIHTFLQDHPQVITKSEGVEPQRKVVLLPK